MSIGPAHFKFCAHVDVSAVTPRLNTENFETQQGIDVNFARIIGSGNDHRALRLDVFVAVIADLVCQGLAGLQSWEKIDARRAAFRAANAGGEQSDRAINGGVIPRATRQIASVIHVQPPPSSLRFYSRVARGAA